MRHRPQSKPHGGRPRLWAQAPEEPPSGSPFGSPRVGLPRKGPERPFSTGHALRPSLLPPCNFSRGPFPRSSFHGLQRKRALLSKQADRSKTHETRNPAQSLAMDGKTCLSYRKNLKTRPASKCPGGRAFAPSDGARLGVADRRTGGRLVACLGALPGP